MHRGEIIAFYRKKKGWTQDKLGEGICSRTHVSKIEKGNTDVSPEIIDLLCDRLNICIECEMNQFSQLEDNLLCWYQSIVKGNADEVESILNKISQVEMLERTAYYPMYNILYCRYLLFKEKICECAPLLQMLSEGYEDLDSHEKDAFNHVYGIYYIKLHCYDDALIYLRKINEQILLCKEYYYHLAIVYFSLGFKVLAYKYANKALTFFREINHFKKIRDVKILLMMLEEEEHVDDLVLIESMYHQLLETCDFLKDSSTKAKLYHNLAFQCYIRNSGELSCTYYQKAMDLKKKYTVGYLRSYHGFVRSYLLRDCSSRDIQSYIKEGLYLSAQLNEEYYYHLFTIYELKQEKIDEYYTYLEKHALPFFIRKGYSEELQQYGKALLLYYQENNQYREGFELAIKLTT